MEVTVGPLERRFQTARVEPRLLDDSGRSQRSSDTGTVHGLEGPAIRNGLSKDIISLLLNRLRRSGHMSKTHARLEELGITLPPPRASVANYVPSVRSGNLLFVSGQICFAADRTIPNRFRGKLGAEVSDEAGREAARQCAINVLALVKSAVGDLDNVVQCVRLGGFVNATPTYGPLPQVMDGASDLMVDLFGDRGRHARATVGVAQLPFDCAVEVEGVFEVR